MAKTVIRLGLRAEETILLRAEQVPPVPAGSEQGVRRDVDPPRNQGRPNAQ